MAGNVVKYQGLYLAQTAIRFRRNLQRNGAKLTAIDG